MSIINFGTLCITGLMVLMMYSIQVEAECRGENEVPPSTPTEEFADQGDGTVLHRRTGLIWMKCPLGRSGEYCEENTGPSSFTWQQALVAAEATDFGGFNDWRLPNINELRSIVEERCFNPAINLTIFPGTLTGEFWSSSPSYGVSAGTWVVDFVDGITRQEYRDWGRPIRLVRSGQ